VEDLQDDPLTVHCFCVCCSGSALLEDLGVGRSAERDSVSVLSICPRIFLSVLFVSSLVLEYSYYVFMCVSCFGLVVSIVSTFQVIV